MSWRARVLLRVSEVVEADIEDLAEEQGQPVLRIRGKGQHTKAVPVPLNPDVRQAVMAAAAERSAGPILLSPTGRRMTCQYAGKIVKRLGSDIGLPELHPHALRHTFVTLALNENISLRDVQDAARHSDPRTTRRYDRDRNNLKRHPTHRLLGVLDA
jgi:integrase